MDAIWSHGFVAAIPAAWWGKTSKAVFDIQWAKRISAYCAVRYGAYNSLWCLSGEYQYAFKDCGWTEESFNDLGRTVQAHNPYGHPLSIHPSAGSTGPRRTIANRRGLSMIPDGWTITGCKPAKVSTGCTISSRGRRKTGHCRRPARCSVPKAITM